MAGPRRPVGDVLVLMVVGTLCLGVLVFGVSLVVVRLVQPEADISTAVKALAGIMNTLVGIAAGFLAGRTSSSREGDDG